MEITLSISDVVVNTEFNSAEIVVTPTFSSGIPDVNKKYVDDGLALKVDQVANHSLVPDTEIDKLSEYPELPEVPEGYYLADDGTFKALPDFVTGQEMEDYVDTILGDINTALETILAIEV